MAKQDVANTKAAKPEKTKSAKPAKNKKPNVFARLAQYFRDVAAEMKRVVWPHRPEVINSSVVVIVTLLFFVVLTLITDGLAAKGLQLLVKIGS